MEILAVGGALPEPPAPDWSTSREAFESDIELAGHRLTNSDIDIVQWKEKINMSPSDFLDRMLGPNKGRTFEGSLTANGPAGEFQVQFLGKFSEKGAHLGEIFRTIQEKGKLATHSHLSVVQSARGRGVGRSILKGQLDLYQSLPMAVDEVWLRANMEAGGYAWARFGIKPVSGSAWRSLADKVKLRLNSIKLPEATRLEVSRILDSSDPASIWDLADLRSPITSTDAPDWVQGKPLPLGRVLLQQQSYPAVLNTADDAAMTRFMAYTGG